MSWLPPHLQIEPIRGASPPLSRRLAILTAVFVECGMAVGCFWLLRSRMKLTRNPPKATFNVELIEDPSPTVSSGKTGSGARDIIKEAVPVIDPVTDLLRIPDKAASRPIDVAMDPTLPLAPGGDGHPKGREGASGSGVGFKGMGPGGLKVRIGDMTILHREQPEYPYAIKEARIEDTIELEVSIDEHGVPVSVKVNKAEVPLLASEAVRAVKLWRFAPVRSNGVAVKATFRMDIQFVILNKRATPKAR